ncbi:hypothetical protein QFC20_004330 [Naganishia adeliensis]|uniref:Uncharacterized protein n=1 Tax=Naganishia adeliensis TaxID=92952 RepID=A0ACC2W266_9TREE|nr:hypothetical protein QFC20_004330 [Naganishia adeliensis]
MDGSMDAMFADHTFLNEYDDRTRKVVLAALVIDCVTLASSGWLFLGIYRQGLQRLRTKFLIGMLVSNVLFSVLAVVSIVLDVCGKRLIMNTPRCNVVGFLFVLVVLTQHAWSLTNAVTTYLMLKYPASRIMNHIEAYWYAAPIFIWCNGAFLAGVWFWKRDFSPSPGSAEWDYAIRGDRLDQNLGEFLPRLFAFCIMTALYISLFFFLRRPDTISIGDISSKNHSSWTDNLKQLAFRGCKKAQPKEEVVPPWEKLQLDFSGVVILPEPASAATRKPSVASVINVITRSPARLTSLFKVNSKERPTALNDQPINGSACPAELTVMPTVDHGLNIRFPAEVDHEYPASAKSIHEAEQNGQTLEAFFKADEKAFVPASTLPGLPSSEAMAESASAYFNRQASLLMFWFPIAYTITLTPSLVRLSAEIARGRDSPTLKLIANLATNSLGLQDVFIYGIVEWTIKRRVRQRLPGHL